MYDNERKAAIAGFSAPNGMILVATHLVSIGLNLPRVKQILNLDVPDSHERYNQGCGRAGRVGELAKIRTAIPASKKSYFDEYIKSHMVDATKNNEGVGLWFNDEEVVYESGNGVVGRIIQVAV